jgi:hypothetical protein
MALDIRRPNGCCQVLIVSHRSVATNVHKDNVAAVMVWRRTGAKTCGDRKMSRVSGSQGKEPACGVHDRHSGPVHISPCR